MSILSHPYFQGQRGCWWDSANRDVLLVLLAMNLCTLRHSASLSLSYPDLIGKCTPEYGLLSVFPENEHVTGIPVTWGSVVGLWAPGQGAPLPTQSHPGSPFPHPPTVPSCPLLPWDLGMAEGGWCLEASLLNSCGFKALFFWNFLEKNQSQSLVRTFFQHPLFAQCSMDCSNYPKRSRDSCYSHQNNTLFIYFFTKK